MRQTFRKRVELPRWRRRSFMIGPVHVRIFNRPATFRSEWIRWTYLLLIPLTLGFMACTTCWTFFAKLNPGAGRHETGAQVSRMNRNFRIAHAGIILSPHAGDHGFALNIRGMVARPCCSWNDTSHCGCGASRAADCAGACYPSTCDSPLGKPAATLVLKANAARIERRDGSVQGVFPQSWTHQNRAALSQIHYAEKMEYGPLCGARW